MSNDPKPLVINVEDPVTGPTRITLEPRKHRIRCCRLGLHPWSMFSQPIQRRWIIQDNPLTGTGAAEGRFPTQFRVCQACGLQQVRRVK